MEKLEKSAGFVIYKKENGKNKYLILHYIPGHWDYAKGHLENGETFMDAAIRETKEETGLTNFNVINGFSEKITYHFKKDNQIITKEVVFFLAESTQLENEVILSHEHKGFKWLFFEEAFKKLTFNSAKQLLKKAEEFLN